MRVIYRGRGEGKSTDILKQSADTGIYILCANQQAAQSLARQASDLGLHIPYPVTVEDYRRTHGFRGSFIQHVLIDDADLVLQEVFNSVFIEGISLTRSE
jgi:hypothetical protein